MRRHLKDRRFLPRAASLRCSCHVVLACVIMLGTSAASAQLGPSPEAAALLERAIAAHSAGPARVRVTYRGTTISADQGRFADGPFAPHPWHLSFAIDEAAEAIAFHSRSAIDGDFTFARHIGFSGGAGFSLGFTGAYVPVATFPADANSFLPHRLLREVLTGAREARIVPDPDYDRLVYRSAAGAEATMLFDRSTRLLIALLRAPVPTGFGDEVRETRFGPYRRVGVAMVPMRIETRRLTPAFGTSVSRLELVDTTAEGPSPAELTRPADAPRQDPGSAAFETVPLGPDVYLLRNVGRDGAFSYNVLVAVFDNYVLVAEAALDNATSARVIEAAERIAPGKPIRTLVQTHHHGDHIGGLRTYIAAGTRIIAPAGMRDLIGRIAGAHSRIAPDALAAAPRAPNVEEVEGETTISDARNEVRLYSFPTDHSAHMLIVYLPRQRVLYQGDLVNAGEIAANDTTRRFLSWLRERRLEVDHLAGLHGRTLAGDGLRRLIDEGRLEAEEPSATQARNP